MEEKKEKKLDRRMIYIMPSILALAIALTSLAYQFGNQIIDFNNSGYFIYLSPCDNEGDDLDFDECITRIDEILLRNNVSDFVLNSPIQGGSKSSDGTINIYQNYQLILMNISRKEAHKIAGEIAHEFGDQHVLVVEEQFVKASVFGGSNYYPSED